MLGYGPNSLHLKFLNKGFDFLYSITFSFQELLSALLIIVIHNNEYRCESKY